MLRTAAEGGSRRLATEVSTSMQGARLARRTAHQRRLQSPQVQLRVASGPASPSRLLARLIGPPRHARRPPCPTRSAATSPPCGAPGGGPSRQRHRRVGRSRLTRSPHRPIRHAQGGQEPEPQPPRAQPEPQPREDQEPQPCVRRRRRLPPAPARQPRPCLLCGPAHGHGPPRARRPAPHSFCGWTVLNALRAAPACTALLRGRGAAAAASGSARCLSLQAAGPTGLPLPPPAPCGRRRDPTVTAAPARCLHSRPSVCGLALWLSPARPARRRPVLPRRRPSRRCRLPQRPLAARRVALTAPLPLPLWRPRRRRRVAGALLPAA